MVFIIALVILGLTFIFFEVIVPGGILGIVGGLSLLGAVFLAFRELGVDGGLLVALGSLFALGLMLFVELKYLPRTGFGSRMFLKNEVAGTSQAPLADRTVVGKQCEAVTMLAPTGVVLLDGKKFEAFSQSGLVDRGTLLQVVDVDNFRLIVKKA